MLRFKQSNEIGERMQNLIDKLHEFSKHDFPVPEVTSYLQNFNLSERNHKQYSFFDNRYYTRNLIFRDEHFEIILLCWGPGQIAPIHGHEGEKCWARVETGTLKFSNYDLLSRDPLQLKLLESIDADVGYLDGPAEIHSVENISDKPASSLHIYARPYDQCEIYDPNLGSIEKTQLAYHSKYGILC